ncbi:hypothetical protein CVN68_13725 [Sphingomonas psychrotolerans]|uniref:DUF2971 domain-containing protein n=1 Tax=Sphingomonas psychrotolerans TaxID=1327635 RepID=A0A2K8MGA4_9SPHN|nr:hypothetical protein CVN68_13725 [Sphingomonas psychrotolerans]
MRRYTSISAVIDILRRKELPLLDPQNWDDRNDRYYMALYKQEKKLGGLYGLCAARCSETYHHWRVFTGTSDGACVEIKRGAFEEALAKLEGVRFGEVQYLRLEQIERPKAIDVDRMPFVKREGFTAEEEYRVIAETGEDQKSALSIEFPHSMINCIYLNPWLPKTVAESIRETLRSLPGCAKLRVSRSQLIESSRWKRAGDEIVGKKAQEKLVLRARSVPTKSASKTSRSTS